MNRRYRAAVAMFVSAALFAAPATLAARQVKPATPPAQAPAPAKPPAAAPKWVAPVKGVAEIGYVVEKPKVVNNEVVTVVKVKNLTTGAIAGLRLDEYWYDAQNNMLPGDSQRLKKPLMPGEVATIELHTPKNPKMMRNSYNFTHANGAIKPKPMKKIE